jgi:PilZ domain
LVPEYLLQREPQSRSESVWSRNVTLAGLGVDGKLLVVFAGSFQRFGVNLNTINLDQTNKSELPKINACVLPLKQEVVSRLAKREWFCARKTVIYGLGGANEISRFARLGIHALLTSKSELSVHSAVDATQPLLARGVGRCARVPMATPVQIENGNQSVAAISRNVGLGGMALHLSRMAELPARVQLKFALPSIGTVSRPASPCWYSGRVVGMRFLESFPSRALELWLLQYASLGCGC